MKTTKKNRRHIVPARPAPLALEARIMFDGAAVDTAVAAVVVPDADASHSGADTSTQLPSGEQAAALASTDTSGRYTTLAPDARPLFEGVADDPALRDAAQSAQQAVRDFLSNNPDDAALFALFNGRADEPSQAWRDAAQRLRADLAEGRFSVQVVAISNAEIGGVFAAFAGSGPNGEPTIFINRDWLAGQPPAQSITDVLVEEMGHAFDYALNGSADTLGDEGEAFASAVLGLTASDADRLRYAVEDDHAVIQVNGQSYQVEQAAITFSALYQGTPSAWSQEANQIANVGSIDGSRFRFTSADPSTPYFSGNNVSGKLTYVDANGVTQSIDGVISRLFKTNGAVQGLYFYAWGNTTLIGDGGAGGDSAERTYLLALDPSKFSNGGTYRTSSDPVDTALNRLIVPNSGPVAVNDSVSVPEGGTISGNMLANDTDANNDVLSIVSVSIGNVAGTLGQDHVIAGVGTLRVNADGSFVFTGEPNYTGPVPVVTYLVSDGIAASTGRLSIAITPVNDAPSGTAKTITLIEDYSYTFSASDFGFSDSNDTPSNSLAAVKITTLPASGTLTLNGVPVLAGAEIAAADIAKLKYTPGADGNGIAYASFTFQVRDNGGTANGGVDTDPAPKTITFNVTAANDAPVANADTAIAVEAGGISNGTAGTNPGGNVLSNDTDPDSGDSKSVSSAASAVQGATAVASGTVITGVYGTLTINANGMYSYVVNNDSAAVQALRQTTDTLADRFTYTVRDAAGLASSSTLTVTIRGANDAPVANNDFNLAVHSATTPAARVNPSGNVLANDSDVDGGDTKAVTQASKGQTLSGSPTDIGTGSLVEGVEGRTYLSFQTQGAGNLKVGDAVTGTGVPAGTTVTGVTTSSGTRTVTLSTNVALDWATLGTSTISVAGNSYTIDALGTPATNVIAISSPTGGAITAGMAVTGSGIQADTTVSSVSTVGGYSFVTLNKAVSGTLGTNVQFGSSGTSIAGDYGTLVLKQDGSYTYTVTASPAGTVYDYFTYKMQDASGASSNAVLKIEINVSNTTPPTAVADANAITENAASISAAAGAGVLANDTGTSKSVTYAWAVNDSSMTAVSAGGTSLTGLYGSINMKSDGSYTYTLNNANPAVDALKPGETLSEQFRYRMTDSGGGVAISTLTITINGANDAPVAGNDSASAIEAGGVANASAGFNPSGNVLSNDSDVEGQALSVSAVSGGTVGQAKAGSYGSLTLNANGTYTYAVDNANATVQALNAGQSITDSFSYTVSDGNGGTATATLTVTISGANDAPENTLPGSTPTVAEGGSVTLSGISVADHDDTNLSVQLSVQNGSLTIGNLNGASVSGGANGSATLMLSGTKAQLDSALATLSYQGNAEFSGTDSLTLTTTDSGGLADVDTLAITVTPDNRPLTVTGSTVNEASPFAFFSVGGAAGQKIALQLQATGSGDGHAASGSDHAPGIEYYNGTSWVAYTGGLIEMPAGGTMLVRVAVLNDAVNEGAETFRLTATNKSGTPASANSTIKDDATGAIYLESNTSGTPNTPSDGGYPAYLDDDRALSVNNIAVNEASPYAVFTISGYSGQVVGLELVGGTATLGTDTGTALQYYDGTTWQNYDGTSVTMTGSSLLVRTSIVQDTAYEGAESFGLVATNLGGGSPALGVATITDDGTGIVFGSTVTGGVPDTANTGLDDDRVLSVSSPLVNEASDYAVFTVTGNTGEQVALSLFNESANGTISGKANIDAGQTLQFWSGTQWENYDSNYLPAIQSGGSLLVRVALGAEHDTTYEGAETFRLSATYASGDTSRSASGTATLIDDGTGVTYPGTVSTVTQTANNVTTVVSSTVDSSTGGLDDDRVLTVSSPVVNEASDHAVFTVTGTPGLSAALQLIETTGAGFADIAEGQTLQVWDGIGWSDVGGSVTFDESGKVYVRIDIRQEQDNNFEGAESFQLRANYTSGNTARTASGTASITDDGTGVTFPGTFTGGLPNTGSSGLDDDRVLTVSSPTVNEGSDYAVLAVNASAGQTITLQLLESTGAGFADINEAQTLQVWNGSAWADYTGSAVVPAGGTLYVRVNVAQEQDTAFEGAETFQLRASYSTGAARQETGTITIIDDGSGLKYPGTMTGGIPDTTGDELDDDRPEDLPAAPVASQDDASATEAGGNANATPGVNPSGTVLGNDSGSSISVVKAQAGNTLDGDASSVTASSSSVSNGTAVTGSYGTLVIGADGSYVYTVDNSLAAVQALKPGQTLSEVFSYQIKDDAAQTATSVLTITINGANDAPIADGANITTDEDVAKSGNLPGATDLDGDSVTYAKASDPAHGSVVVNADGSYTYTPATNYHGSDSFSYTVSDGNGGSNTYTISITVTPVNDAPVAANASITTDEDVAKSGNLPGATDADGSVTYAKASNPSHGSVVVNADGSYTYTPATNYHGSDSFSYTVSDGNGGSNTYTVSITVNPINDAPVAANASITTDEDTTKSGNLPGATDADGDSVTYAKASNPSHGSVVVNADGSYTYTPTANYHGSDSFSYTVSDGNGGSNTYTVSITVNPINDAPVAANASITTNEDVAKSGNLPGATDADGDSVTYAKASNPSHGSVVVNADGSYTYTPTANYHGSDSFSYTVSDGNGGSNTYTISITVSPINDAPVAANASITTDEDVAKSGNLPGATDADGDSVTYAKASDPAHGSVVVNADGSYTYTPTTNYHGSDSFSYTVSDGNGGSNTYTISITVSPINDAPVAANASITTDEDVAKSGNLPGATDADGDSVTYAKASNPSHGSVVVNADGSYTYTPTANYHGSDSFSYTVSDGNGGSNTYTISIAVSPVNDAPVAANASITTDEDTAKNGNLPGVTDADGDIVTYAKASNPANGSVVVNADGSYIYTPAADYNGADSFTYTINDGKGGSRTYTVSITVNPVDEAPIPLPPQPKPTPPVPQPPAPQPPVSPPPAPVPPVVQPAPFVPVDVKPVGNLPGAVNDGAPGTGIGFGTRAIDVLPEQAIRRSAEVSDVYTRSEGFRTVVAKADEPALVVFRGVPDQYTEGGNRLSLTIPADAFAHTQPKEVVRLAATLQDGQPLPSWVQFNAQTGQFTGEVPAGMTGELRIKVIARDMEGREATALFRVNVGRIGDKGLPVREGGGKVGLSEQMRQQAVLLRPNEKLAKLAKAAAAARG